MPLYFGMSYNLSMDLLSEKFNDLTEVSKVRRFIFSDLGNMGLKSLYNTYWLEMENLFIDASERVGKNLFELFLVDYLTIQKNAVIPKKENLLKEFVDFYQEISKFQSREIIIKNIFRYSMYYLRITFADLQDEDIRRKIKTINALMAYDSYPFLMEIFEDYEFAHINRAMLLEILDTVLGFINERNSKKPSQIALSFAGLSTEINKMLVLKDYTPHFVVEETNYLEKETINSMISS